MDKGIVADKYSNVVDLVTMCLEKYKIPWLEFIYSDFVAYSGHLSRRTGELHVKCLVVHEADKTRAVKSLGSLAAEAVTGSKIVDDIAEERSHMPKGLRGVFETFCSRLLL